MSDAVRTIREDDDTHTIEGRLAYSGPFRGRDTYGTTFTARTDYALALHPQGIPVLYAHGFDPDFGLGPIGMTVPPASFRSDADGVWVEMQLDKRNKYYATRVRPLLDKQALGLSQGSAEHSVRIDRNGEVLQWPLHEVSLTPVEANPFNVVATRAAETIDVIRIIAGTAVRMIRQEEGKWVIYSEDGSKKLGTFDSEEEAKARLAEIEGFKAERSAEIGLDPLSETDHAELVALRAGRKISAASAAQIQQCITALQGLLAETDSPSEPEPAEASRSAEPLPTVTIVEREHAEPLRIDIAGIATQAARQEVSFLLKR